MVVSFFPPLYLDPRFRPLLLKYIYIYTYTIVYVHDSRKYDYIYTQ